MPDSDIKRGDIYNVDWGEDAGIHPALIVQNDIGNRYSDSTIVAYISHTVKKNPPILVEFKDHETSLPHGGSINLARIMTVPKSLLRGKVGRLSSKKMADVNRAIAYSLGLER